MQGTIFPAQRQNRRPSHCPGHRPGHYLAALAGLAILAPAPVMAAAQIFSGQDNGVGPGDSFTNSRAAEAAFLAAAATVSSDVRTENFESAAIGDFSPVVLADFTLTTDALNYGYGLSGISDYSYGSLYGFNTTPGGDQWYGFPNFDGANAALTFGQPLIAVGAWFTGIQTVQTTSLTVTLLGGGEQIFQLPVNADGGAQFYGVVSDTPFTRVTLNQLSFIGDADAFGIDDVSYAFSGSPTPPTPGIPEPATWALLIAGFGLVGARARRESAGTATRL